MRNNSQKRGVALGAVFAMLASFFVGAAPANAAAVDGGQIALTPYEGTATNFNGTIVEDFPVHAYLLPGVSSGSAQTHFVYEVTRVSGAVDILVGLTANADIAIADLATAASASGTPSVSLVPANQTTASKFVGVGSLANGAVPLVIRAYTDSGAVTLSAQTAVVTVKVWIENSATDNNNHDSLEWFTTKTVTLHATSAVPVAGSMTALVPGDITVSATTTIGALNFENLSGTFFLQMNATANSFVDSSDPTSTESSAISADTMTSRSGVLSDSFAVSGSAGVNALDSFSARAYYVYNSTNYALGSTFSSVVSNPNTGEIYLDVVPGDNATQSGTTATVRTNTTTTFTIGTVTSSTSVSRVVSVKIDDTDSNLSSTKLVSINGATATTSLPTTVSPVSVTTNATSGQATFTIANQGFVGGETYVITAYIGNVSKSLTVNTDAATWSLTPVYTQYQSGAGETTNVAYTVKDQWGAKSTRTDHRVMFTRGGSGFNYATTISYVAVVGGDVALAFTPAPAAQTGSATLNASLQVLNANSGGYISAGVADASAVSINVSAASNAFTTGLAASRSVSISYFPSTVSWVAITGNVANTGSAIAVTGTGLVFRDSTGATYSGAVTVRAAGDLSYTFDVAGTLAGDYTMTLVNGSASTTSALVVDPASHSAGAAMTFDTTAITAGKTRIVTGTLVDANGNPVDTTQGGATASILVTYTGTAGIPVGTMPTETDADGKFRINILTSAADSGTFTLTAVYLKDGASTAAKDKITATQAITVGDAAASTPSADQKVNAGSFKGYVAVYAKGYAGKRLSAKIGNDWVVVESLESNFERVTDFTGAGYTIAVRIYIDRVLVDTITVTTK